MCVILLGCGFGAGSAWAQAPAAVAQRAAPMTTRIDFVEFSGNASLSGAVLQDTLKTWIGRDLTFVQMNQMAQAVTDLYRKRGYMVATAYVAAQTVRNRTLKVTVVEGTFSDVAVRTNRSTVPNALILRTLATSLCGRSADCRGVGPVRKAAVERAGLLVAEIPGVRATYELAPGAEDGSTSLFADVTAAPKLAGTVGGDNGGLAVTGRWRASLNVTAANLLGRGDRASLFGAYSGKGFLSFSADASLPTGYRGVRVGVTAGHTRYALGREFSVLDATGVSDAIGAYASYPLIRAFDQATDLRAEVIGKRIRNDIGILDLHSKEDAAEGVVTLSGSRLDHLLTTGSTQYRLGLLAGRLRLRDPVTRAFDAATARTAGNFGKVGYSVSREEVIRTGWTAFAQLSGQWAFSNLDSSEKFGLSGPQGVRAYATGAVAADTVTLLTVESRVSVPSAWTPGHQVTVAPFYDYGRATFNADDWAGYTGRRSGQLAGGGVYLSVVAPERYALKAGVAVRQHTSNDAAGGARARVWLEAAAVF